VELTIPADETVGEVTVALSLEEEAIMTSLKSIPLQATSARAVRKIMKKHCGSSRV
jgi:hypothetical protein